MYVVGGVARRSGRSACGRRGARQLQAAVGSRCGCTTGASRLADTCSARRLLREPRGRRRAAALPAAAPAPASHAASPTRPPHHRDDAVGELPGGDEVGPYEPRRFTASRSRPAHAGRRGERTPAACPGQCAEERAEAGVLWYQPTTISCGPSRPRAASHTPLRHAQRHPGAREVLGGTPWSRHGRCAPDPPLPGIGLRPSSRPPCSRRAPRVAAARPSMGGGRAWTCARSGRCPARQRGAVRAGGCRSAKHGAAIARGSPARTDSTLRCASMHGLPSRLRRACSNQSFHHRRHALRQLPGVAATGVSKRRAADGVRGAHG